MPLSRSQKGGKEDSACAFLHQDRLRQSSRNKQVIAVCRFKHVRALGLRILSLTSCCCESIVNSSRKSVNVEILRNKH